MLLCISLERLEIVSGESLVSRRKCASVCPMLGKASCQLFQPKFPFVSGGEGEARGFATENSVNGSRSAESCVYNRARAWTPRSVAATRQRHAKPGKYHQPPRASHHRYGYVAVYQGGARASRRYGPNGGHAERYQ